MVKIRFKTPSKSKIKRDLRRAVTKNLKCPGCGRNMPTTTLSKSVCSSCGFTIHL